ncbi:MAG TPA: MFS transporter [Bryobacterales bacterium]|nr:MFS transporter [Bryobacterales bacterium]
MITAAQQAAGGHAERVNWWLLALLVASCCINYIDRGNLSIAAPQLAQELSLGPKQLGLLLSAFFWTYAAFQLVSGFLVDHFDVYRVFGAGFFLWSVATALTGFIGSFGALFALRLLLGVGESIAYPAYSRMLASDFPERNRGIANALIDAGSKTGPALGTLIGGLVIARWGWRALFFALGFGAFLFLPPWFLSIPRYQTRFAVAQRQDGGPGFLEIVRVRAAWGTFIGLFAGNYVWYFLLTWLPSYLVMERHYSIRAMAIYGSLPFWGIAVSSIFGGWLSDRLIARGGTPTRVRKSFAVSGLLLCTLLLPAAMVPDMQLSMALLIVACLSFGLFTSNLWAITQTLAGPQAAGKWTGIQNGIGNLAGIAAPFLTGVIVSRTGSFLLAFVAVFFILLLGALAYLVLVGKVEQVAWRPRAAAQPAS